MSNNKKVTEEDFLKNKQRRKGAVKGKNSKKNTGSGISTIRWIVYAILIALGLALFSGLVWGITWVIDAFISPPDESNSNNQGGNFTNAEGELINRAEGEDGSKRYYTFLATATDAGESLTDVIMVARFDYSDEAPSVSILQIPRDTYVKISSGKLYFNKDGTLSRDNFTTSTANHSIKINEAYYRGKLLAKEKINSLLKEVEGKSDSEIEALASSKEYIFLDADTDKLKKYASATDAEKKQIDKDIRKNFGIKYLQTLIYYNFGIPTDYYAQVNIKGFRGVVDAIGGVDLNVPTRMYYVDEYQDLYIDLYPGQQHLDGKKAEQFVRFRNYPGGDIARLDAQKLFIDAFLDKLVSPSTITKINDIMTEIQKNLYTDISFKNLVNFGNKAIKMDIGADVSIQTLPGDGEYIGEVSYFVANRDKIIELVNKDFNVFETDLIAEDFCIIASESIVRPAVSVDDRNDEDEENNGEKTGIENEDENKDDGENSDGNDDGNDDETDNDGEDVTDNNENDSNSEENDSDSDGTADSDGENKAPDGDKTDDSKADNDGSGSSANLELLEQMLAENQE